MTIVPAVLAALALQAAPATLEERIDLFDPVSGAYRGSERTFFGADGRRLRLEVTDAAGQPTLLLFVRHDDRGRESEAIYFEGGGAAAARETFAYSADGRLKTTTYLVQSGVPGERTESDLDPAGREVQKRYYRADGTQYGAEQVLWNADGTRRGWDFRYLLRAGGASFRYTYQALDDARQWVRRLRHRDGAPERTEVRSRVVGSLAPPRVSAAPFAPGRVSTEVSETSPSFSRDGKTLVFARYEADWTQKTPFIAHLQPDGWRVEPLAGIGSVYNLAIAPNGMTIIYAKRTGDARTLFRIRRTDDGWSTPENLTEAHNLSGTYPCLTQNGDLIFFDASGASGAGIYRAPRLGQGFGAVVPLYVPTSGTTFDAYTDDDLDTLLVSRCLDDACESTGDNGVWEVPLDNSAKARKLPSLPYAWGVQPVDALGLLVFTDGEEILAVPLAVAGLGRGAGIAP